MAGGGKPTKGGKKNRKHGRNRDSHAMKRYAAEDRCAKNKARNIAREQRRQGRSR